MSQTKTPTLGAGIDMRTRKCPGVKTQYLASFSCVDCKRVFDQVVTFTFPVIGSSGDWLLRAFKALKRRRTSCPRCGTDCGFSRLGVMHNEAQ